VPSYGINPVWYLIDAFFFSPGEDIFLDAYPPVFSAAVVMRIAAHV
jgi:hypothetical protein